MELADSAVYPAASEELVRSNGGQDWMTPAIYRGFILDIRPRPQYNKLQTKDLNVINNGKWINRVNISEHKDIYESNGYIGVKMSGFAIDNSSQKQLDLIADFNGNKKEYYDLFEKILRTFKFLE